MTAQISAALLVEDDPSWQEILKEILNDYGLKVECTNNLANAVEMLRKAPYRLAIVDLSLAGKDHHNQDGLQVLAAIKRLAPGCSSILLTGHASVELAVAAIQTYGAQTCLQKENFQRKEFLENVHKALTRSTSLGPMSVDVDTKPNAYGMVPSKSSNTQSAKLALVIEDDAGWRNLLTEYLHDSGFEVHVAASYGEAIGLMQREDFQLAIADISLASSLKPDHNLDGYRLLENTHKAQIPTIIVSGIADLELIDRAFAEFQIFAYFEKQAFNRNTFMKAIGEIREEYLIPHNLTNREVDVLVLLAQGLTNKEIAGNLHITTNTVKRHLKSIYVKLDVNTRAAASAFAVRQRIRRN
jgi:DNA-binding NarL/FixJ family response regulator